MAQPVGSIPSYMNEVVRGVMSSLDEFIFDEDMEGDMSLPIFGGFKFDDDSVYYGSWRYGQRHGRGIQIYVDGSIYMGYWRDNNVQGKGRLIYKNGDVYTG